MNVDVIFLNHKRYNLAYETMKHNIANAGHPFNLITVDVKGLAKAMNVGLSKSSNHVMFMGNDILEPNNWLQRRVELMEYAPFVGICSIGFDKTHEGSAMLIGNYFIRREVIEKIGGFNVAFDPYGPIDLDYNARCLKAGWDTQYVPGEKAIHIGGGHGADGDGTCYGFSKEEEVKRTWGMYVNSLSDSDYLINKQQYFGEDN